jgi:TPR repeat protein
MKPSRGVTLGASIIAVFVVAATGSRAPAEPPKSGKGYDEKAFDNSYQSCIDWSDGRACTALGYMYAAGQGVAKDEAKAVELYEKGCRYNDPRGCTALGLMLAGGVGVPKDLVKAAESFEKGCERGDLRSCINLGFLCMTGQGVAQDEARGLKLFQKGCDGGNAVGCNNLFGYHATLCRNGKAAHCLEGSRWIQATLKKKENLPEGLQFDQGSVSQLLAEATRILQTACDAGDAQGCSDLASIYASGEGVALDKSKATELYRKACALGLETACSKK